MPDLILDLVPESDSLVEVLVAERNQDASVDLLRLQCAVDVLEAGKAVHAAGAVGWTRRPGGGAGLVVAAQDQVGQPGVGPEGGADQVGRRGRDGVGEPA